ncbi:rCG24171 [Rattus norvegicus]|uniref:RCG24171 n=1 Tax=Rattus norvegicus TaxID=10116 RepID=A6KAI7_RAT|nr:rCG24171 [Rattus norvegicus]
MLWGSCHVQCQDNHTCDVFLRTKTS